MATLITAPRTGVARRVRRALRIGAAGWIVVGGGHFLADIASRVGLISTTPELQRVEEQMRATAFPIFDSAGPDRSYFDVMTTISLGLGIGMVTAGVLFWLLARLVDRRSVRSVVILGLIMSGAMFAINIAFNPLLQIILTGATFAAFAVAALGIRDDEDARS